MKQSIVSEEAVIEEVKKAVADTLNIDMETIKPEHSLIGDLNAESLDFLDINYRLEQAFGIRMARHFILEHIEEMFGEGSAIDENSQLTAKAVSLLAHRMGEDIPELKAGMDMDEVPALITIQSMARGVMDILDSLPESCPACGAKTWKTAEGSRISCGSCSAPAPFAGGDDLIRQWLTDVQKEHRIF